MGLAFFGAREGVREVHQRRFFYGPLARQEEGRKWAKNGGFGVEASHQKKTRHL
jgi:hypothetical protein